MNEKALESFIGLCDEMMVPVQEGVNRDVAKMLKDSDVREASRLIKESKSLIKQKEFDDAKEKLARASGLINNIKRVVDGMPEPNTRWERVVSALTPIFSTLPEGETTAIGNTIITYTYPDSMSNNTKSSTKSRVQLRLNYLLKRIGDVKALCGKKEKKYDKQMAKKESKG